MANDHYVARTYLKRLCHRARGQPMQAYRKPTGASFPCWPDAVCAEAEGDLNPKYFQDPTVLGQFRSIFEPRWDAALDALEKGKMTADDKFVIAGYWANLMAATPAWRKIGQQLYAQELQSIAPIISKNFPPPASLKDVKLTVEIDEDYIKAVVTRNLLSGALQLYHQAWTILTNATAHEFLTSDNPSGIFPPKNVGGPVVRILPLSPRLCISTIMERQPALKTNLTQADFAAPPRGGLTYQAIVSEGVKFANRLTVVNAERFVFSKVANSGVEALVKKWGDYSAQLEHSSTTTSSGIKTEAKLFVGRNRR